MNYAKITRSMYCTHKKRKGIGMKRRFLCMMLAMTLTVSAVPVSAAESAGVIAAAETNENLALGKTASASSEEANTVVASNAVDGNTTDRNSRWGSNINNNGGPEWFAVDLGSVQTVKSVKIFWENRKATAYKIQTSTDGTTWTDVMTSTERPSSTTDVINLTEAVEAQHVRLYIDSFTAVDPDDTSKSWATVSIYELEVYSNDQALPVVLEPTIETPKKGDTKLVVNLPEEEGYTTTYNGTDYEQVVGDDLTIYQPLVDTEVKVSFKRVNNENEKDYSFKEISVVIPGKYSQEEGDNEAPKVLPELREWKGKTGNFVVSDSMTVVAVDEELKETAEALAADYKDLTGKEMKVLTGKNATGNIYLSLTTDTSKGLQEEGYLMDIDDTILVEAETTTGAFWATRTILQAMKLNDFQSVPKGITRDYPLYEVRGLILDVGRKTFTMDYLEQIVKEMSWYKMNDFHVHLNDNYIFLENYTDSGLDPLTAYSGFRLESNVKKGGNNGLNQADLTSTDVFYTKQEFRDFITESAVYGVEIVPEFDAPAHSLAFTKVRPDLRTGTSKRENDHLDLKNQYEECFDFITGIWAEYLTAEEGESPVFPEGGTVHIGCDEYTADGDAFRNFCNDMSDYIKDTGRTVRIWGSLTEIKGTKKDDGTASINVDGTGIQMNLWNFGYANMDEMYESGFDLINCNDGHYYVVPNAGYYYDYLNASVMYNLEPNTISNVTIPAGDKQMLGASFAVWNDMIDLKENGVSEYDVYLRISQSLGLFAAKLWGKGDMTQEEATEACEFFGDAPNTNFAYEVEEDASGNVASWKANDFAGMDSENVGVTAADGKEAVELKGGKSYLTTGLETVGLNHKLKATIKRTSASTEEQILFESPYGVIKAVDGTTGKVAIERENHNYVFNYTLPVNEWTEIEIYNQSGLVSLYVNGELTDTLGDDETITVGDSTRNLMATCMFPVAKIGSETNAFQGLVASVEILGDGYYPQENVTVTASSEELVSETTPASNAADGDTGTFWHSQYSSTPATPHWIQMELKDVELVDGFVYVPRQSGKNGNITSYTLEVSKDGQNWTQAASGTWSEDSSAKTVSFPAAEAKYIRLNVVASVGGFASAAEIKAHVTSADKTEFDDVQDENKYYYTPVYWAAEKGITKGRSETVFDPQGDVTRGELVTFLWRLAGEPQVSGSHPFTDVSAGRYYNQAVLWAYKNQIVTGTSATTFAPNDIVTRGQVVTFLYRYAGKPQVSGTVSFPDVYKTKYYYDAVVWAATTKVTTGNVDGTFTPNEECSRAQAVTFIYKTDSLK